LIPFSDKTASCNAGFSQGFTGVPLKGHHTQEFIYGYKNGTSTYGIIVGQYGVSMVYQLNTTRIMSCCPVHYSETCPSGHTQEYCAGYSAGYNPENYVLAK